MKLWSVNWTPQAPVVHLLCPPGKPTVNIKYLLCHRLKHLLNHPLLLGFTTPIKNPIPIIQKFRLGELTHSLRMT